MREVGRRGVGDPKELQELTRTTFSRCAKWLSEKRSQAAAQTMG
ncbi:hypothetical protein [Cohnella soli]|uniref:Uncharacterized protein n=1 Tax=Cohnella soli TaxID=425005 RepID=A0ABW0HQ07_9BACL